MKRSSTVSLLMGLLLIGMTGTAAAAEKTGTQDCGMHGQKVRINSWASGSVNHYAPSGTLQKQYFNGHTLERDSTTTSLSAASWRVTTNRTLMHSDTYATCTGT